MISPTTARESGVPDRNGSLAGRTESLPPFQQPGLDSRFNDDLARAVLRLADGLTSMVQAPRAEASQQCEEVRNRLAAYGREHFGEFANRWGA